MLLMVKTTEEPSLLAIRLPCFNKLELRTEVSRAVFVREMLSGFTHTRKPLMKPRKHLMGWIIFNGCIQPAPLKTLSIHIHLCDHVL